jgi:hypothetical protein
MRSKKSLDCELISTCPYYNNADEGQVIPENFKEQYCHGIYVWCGRYLSHRASEERKTRIACIESK